jgi:hypothetical protein
VLLCAGDDRGEGVAGEGAETRAVARDDLAEAPLGSLEAGGERRAARVEDGAEARGDSPCGGHRRGTRLGAHGARTVPAWSAMIPPAVST